MNNSKGSFQELFTHLEEVQADPQLKRLNSDILRDAQNNLSSTTPREILWSLLANGERLLNIIQEDPRPLTRLLEVDISFIPFDEIKDAMPSHKLLEGLLSPSTSIQVLCLAYLRKAADSPGGFCLGWPYRGHCQTIHPYLVDFGQHRSYERALEALMVLLGVDHVD